MPVLSEGTGSRKEIIGVVHLLALPGSPGWQGDLDEVVGHAMRDAEALAQGGIDAVIFENFGDVPFLTGPIPPEAVAAMGVVIDRVAKSIDVPFGVNVLRNDPIAALGLAYATGGEFIRVNVHTGVMVTDQGIIEGGAAETVETTVGAGGGREAAGRRVGKARCSSRRAGYPGRGEGGCAERTSRRPDRDGSIHGGGGGHVGRKGGKGGGA